GQSEESSKWWRMGKPAFSWRRGAGRSLLPHCYASWRIPAWAAPWDLRGGGAWRSDSAGRASPKEPSRCIEMPSRNSNKANDGIRRARWNVRDLKTGTTTLVSVNSAGTASGNSASARATISADGRVVAFQSFATDPVAYGTSGFRDVFVRDLRTSTTTQLT